MVMKSASSRATSLVSLTVKLLLRSNPLTWSKQRVAFGFSLLKRRAYLV